MHILPMVAVIIAGLCTCAAAQGRYQELTRLRGEADEALKRATGVMTIAWREIADYAKVHRALCGISAGSLDKINKRRAEAAEQTKNVCTGRRPPLPAEIR